MKKLLIKSALVLFTTASISCNSSKGAATAKTMADTTWKLVRMNGKAVNAADYSDKGMPTATFKDGQLSGYGGCNSYSGTYTLKEDGAIKIGPVMSTKMFCNKGSEGETEYYQALDKVNTAKTEGNSLILLNGSTELLAYTK